MRAEQASENRAVTADSKLALERVCVRAGTGKREVDATPVPRLAVEGAQAELAASRERRAAAESLFAATDPGGSELDFGAIDRLNQPPSR